jgi:hypothetical protein
MLPELGCHVIEPIIIPITNLRYVQELSMLMKLYFAPIETPRIYRSFTHCTVKPALINSDMTLILISFYSAFHFNYCCI